jgi:lysophospholipase L1-like esterase
MMRDVAGKKADLVTVMFGYNEMCAKPEEREAATKAFVENLVAYVEEVAALMERPPAAVFIATTPGREKHWETLDCFAEGVRGLSARFPNVTVADAGGRFKAMGQEACSKLMADEAHPSEAGQKELAKVVFEAITGEKPAE